MVVDEIDQLVGEILVEIVDDAAALIRLSVHIDDQVGTHRRPEHHPTTFGWMRIAGLPVIGDYDRLVPLKPKPDDPGERRVDEAQPDPLAGLHGKRSGNAPVDRDGIADTARHARFHAIAEAGCDPALIVEPPILDEPQNVAIDGYRLALLDDQCAGKPTPKLLQRVGVRVIL